MDFAEFKKFFLFNLIGSLVLCAAVAVVTVLFGTFSETSAKVLFTLAMVVVHSLISLSFIWDNERQNTFERLAFFTNVVFFLIVLSFITSIFGIWNIIPGQEVWHLYMTYLLFGFAALHGNILYKAVGKEKYIDNIVYSNYLFMAIVVLMMLPVIYLKNPATLGDFFFRGLGAAGIIDGTLSILTIIFFKLYMHSHPKEASDLANASGTGKERTHRYSLWVWILVIYLLFQVGSVFRYMWH